MNFSYTDTEINMPIPHICKNISKFILEIGVINVLPSNKKYPDNFLTEKPSFIYN